MKIKQKSGLFCFFTIFMVSAWSVIGAAETRLRGFNLSLKDEQVSGLQGGSNVE